MDLPIKNGDFPVRFLYVYQRVDDRQVGSEYGGVDGGQFMLTLHSKIGKKKGVTPTIMGKNQA